MTHRTWSEFLRLLDTKQPIPKIYKTGEAVEFWREWDPNRNKAVWGKSYLRSSSYDLSAFNQAEFEWLRRLSDNKVANTYRASLLMHEGTMLAEPARVTIKTLDCGPTLCDWLRAPLSVEGSTQTHCLVQPEAYLTMVLNVMVALNGVHACHFVHCDIHPGNITLPVDVLGQNGTEVRLRPLWDQMTLIDFGYSVNPSQPPMTTLPLSHSGKDMRISMHLQSILQEIEEQARPLLGGKEWSQVWLDTRWWQQLGPSVSPLKAFARLDWREDLYQLGRMLKDIRDGTGMACHLDGRTIRKSSCQPVEDMISQLPEQLIALGTSQTLGQDRPHLRIIGNIQQVLAQSRAMGNECPKEFHLKRADFEPEDGLASPALETRLSSPRPPLARPSWARHDPSLPLPDMKPVRCATSPSGQLMVASTPTTWRQWRSACQHNPELHRPGLLAQSNELPQELLDTAVSEVSHDDCLAYIDTINHLCNDGIAPGVHYRLPHADEWGVLSAGAAPVHAPPEPNAVHKPVLAWHPGANGLAGLHHHLWQWLAATEGASWALVRGGCAALSAAIPPAAADPVDCYPTNYRSRFITLRLVCSAQP